MVGGMNYPDEDYVRYYTRETVSWIALGWEGQAVLALMLHGKFDRSGIFDCDGHDPAAAVTIVTTLPPSVTTVGLKRLLDAGTWVYVHGKLVWPNYVEGQSCRRADRLRQQESRESRKNTVLSKPVTSGDKGDTGHQSHPESQTVTPSLAKPSLTKERGAASPAATPSEVSRRGWRRFPTTTKPSPKHIALAAELGVNLDLEYAKILDHEFAKPRRDPDATLSNWIRNAHPTLPPRRKAASDPGATARLAAVEAKRAAEREAHQRTLAAEVAGSAPPQNLQTLLGGIGG